MPLRRRCRPRGRRAAGWLTGALLALAAPVALAAPADDWSLEHRNDDPKLVSQRMAKLERSPFDGAQWRALTKALGVRGLAAKIDRARASRPKSVALTILHARVVAAQGDPAGAASILAALEGKSQRWGAKIFDQRMRWLDAAGHHQDAAAALESRAATRRGAERKALLEQAFAMADRADDHDHALSLARVLAEGASADAKAQLRLARAATRAGQGSVADEAYAAAIDHGHSRDRDELSAERAKARMATDNATGAAELLWSLLEVPGRGTRLAREAWWDDLADAHRRAGTTDVLVTSLGRWLRRNDTEAAAWRTLAQAQQTAGLDPTEAWRSALRAAPRDVQSHVALVETLLDRAKTHEAIEEYGRLLSRHPSEVELGLTIAGRLMARGDRAQGMELALQIEGRVARKPKSLLLVLDFYNLNDETDRALEIAERVVDLRPRSPDARIALGEQLYQMNRVDDAVAQWSRLPKLIRPAHRGQAKLAEVLSEHGRTSEAVAALKVALKAQPQQPAYVRLRAMLAEEQRRPDLALGLWEKVRELAGDGNDRLLRDEARTRVVELLVGGAIPNRRLRLANTEQQALKILSGGTPRPEAIEAGRLLAELYTRRENYGAAVTVQQRLLELDADDPDRLADLAAAQRRAGQVTSALGTLEELLDVEPTRSADTLAEMSELAFEAGDADRALEAATRAVNKDRSRVDALIHLGELHERRGDTDQAQRAYAEAIEADPRDVSARLRQAELLLTLGQTERAATAFREILDLGGPPDLLRAAGRRALDLAEVADSTDALFTVAVRRTAARPEADEPRQFLLEALERMEPSAVERWLRQGDADGARAEPRIDQLRQPLIVALGRGSVSTRRRAARQLGLLGLPATAEPLATLAASLRAPRDSTATVRAAFDRTRITAIEAAGRLRDPAAVERFREILEDTTQTGDTRRAAAWALAGVGGRPAAAALSRHVESGFDPMLTSLGCLALASRPRDEIDSHVAFALSSAARRHDNPTVRHACAFAEAVLTPDTRVRRLLSGLRATDPMQAAIAAWRIGRLPAGDDTGIAALFERFLGPAGLSRDAAAAALIARHRGHAPPLTDLPAPTRNMQWATTIDRWLRAQVAPKVDPIEPGALTPWLSHLATAVEATQQGTRAEQRALRRVRCGPANGAAQLCLHPLTDGPITLP